VTLQCFRLVGWLVSWCTTPRPSQLVVDSAALGATLRSDDKRLFKQRAEAATMVTCNVAAIALVPRGCASGTEVFRLMRLQGSLPLRMLVASERRALAGNRPMSRGTQSRSSR